MSQEFGYVVLNNVPNIHNFGVIRDRIMDPKTYPSSGWQLHNVSAHLDTDWAFSHLTFTRQSQWFQSPAICYNVLLRLYTMHERPRLAFGVDRPIGSQHFMQSAFWM